MADFLELADGNLLELASGTGQLLLAESGPTPPPSGLPIVVDADAVLIASLTTTILFPAAVGTEVLVLMLTTVSVNTFGSVSINGDANRDALSFSATTGQTVCHALVYPLTEGDASANVAVTDPTAVATLSWAMIDDSSLNPTDWELFANSENNPDTPETAAWDALDLGIIVGAASILADVLITEPYDWTFISTIEIAAISTCFAYGSVTVAGAQTADVFGGEIPGGATGDTYWFGVYRIGLRLRDGGAWSTGGSVATTTPGPSEPASRQFPPDPTIPNLPPPPTAIVVPTRPWIPKTGQYRPGGSGV